MLKQKHKIHHRNTSHHNSARDHSSTHHHTKAIVGGITKKIGFRKALILSVLILILSVATYAVNVHLNKADAAVYPIKSFLNGKIKFSGCKSYKSAYGGVYTVKILVENQGTNILNRKRELRIWVVRPNKGFINKIVDSSWYNSGRHNYREANLSAYFKDYIYVQEWIYAPYASYDALGGYRNPGFFRNC